MPAVPLLNLRTISKHFGTKALFEGISMTVSEGERIALIGPNGSGKSTLLKLMAHLDEPDDGLIQTRNDLRTTYVPQQDIFDDKLTVSETLEKALVAAGHADYEIAGLISVALGKVGFDDHNALVGSLSGGWRKRLAIVRGLIMEPELLLLDEPTNHLDISGILWLEKLLLDAPFTIVFISHDRYFIEQLATRVIEIHRRYPDGYFSASGDYADFLEARELQLTSLQKTQDSLANKVRREVEWLRQGAKARTTKSKHRIAEAGRLSKELESFQLDEKRVSLEFGATNRKTKELIKLEKVTKGFGERTLFKDISLILSPGKRLGIVGPNGTGKTTFLKVLLGELKPDKGHVAVAPNLRVAFFDQARKQLDGSLTLRRALCGDNNDGVVFNGKSLHVAAWAARFLFTHEQLSTPVYALSGGEQARVLLAKVMLAEADVIVFDEPTNDLDISTLEILEESFNEFPGAIVLVTHDRYLLDRTSNMVLGLGDGEAALFGDYHQWERSYLEWQNSASKQIKSDAQNKTESTDSRSIQTGLSKEDKRELGRIPDQISKEEALVKRLEDELVALQTSADTKRFNETCTKLADAQQRVENLYRRWQELETLA